MLYGTVDDSISHILSNGFPRIAYPDDSSLNSYYLAENLFLNLRLQNLLEGTV